MNRMNQFYEEWMKEAKLERKWLSKLFCELVYLKSWVLSVGNKNKKQIKVERRYYRKKTLKTCWLTQQAVKKSTD